MVQRLELVHSQETFQEGMLFPSGTGNSLHTGHKHCIKHVIIWQHKKPPAKNTHVKMLLLNLCNHFVLMHYYGRARQFLFNRRHVTSIYFTNMRFLIDDSKQQCSIKYRLSSFDNFVWPLLHLLSLCLLFTCTYFVFKQAETESTEQSEPVRNECLEDCQNLAVEGSYLFIYL